MILKLQSKPKYAVVYDDILSKIKSNEILIGDKLPSLIAASEIYNVSSITIRKVYDMLRVDGYIKAVKTAGFYVIKK